MTMDDRNNGDIFSDRRRLIGVNSLDIDDRPSLDQEVTPRVRGPPLRHRPGTDDEDSAPLSPDRRSPKKKPWHEDAPRIKTSRSTESTSRRRSSVASSSSGGERRKSRPWRVDVMLTRSSTKGGVFSASSSWKQQMKERKEVFALSGVTVLENDGEQEQEPPSLRLEKDDVSRGSIFGDLEEEGEGSDDGSTGAVMGNRPQKETKDSLPTTSLPSPPVVIDLTNYQLPEDVPTVDTMDSPSIIQDLQSFEEERSRVISTSSTLDDTSLPQHAQSSPTEMSSRSTETIEVPIVRDELAVARKSSVIAELKINMGMFPHLNHPGEGVGKTPAESPKSAIIARLKATQSSLAQLCKDARPSLARTTSMSTVLMGEPENAPVNHVRNCKEQLIEELKTTFGLHQVPEKYSIVACGQLSDDAPLVSPRTKTSSVSVQQQIQRKFLQQELTSVLAFLPTYHHQVVESGESTEKKMVEKTDEKKVDEMERRTSSEGIAVECESKPIASAGNDSVVADSVPSSDVSTMKSCSTEAKSETPQQGELDRVPVEQTRSTGGGEQISKGLNIGDDEAVESGETSSPGAETAEGAAGRDSMGPEDTVVSECRVEEGLQTTTNPIASDSEGDTKASDPSQEERVESATGAIPVEDQNTKVPGDMTNSSKGESADAGEFKYTEAQHRQFENDKFDLGNKQETKIPSECGDASNVSSNLSESIPVTTNAPPPLPTIDGNGNSVEKMADPPNQPNTKNVEETVSSKKEGKANKWKQRLAKKKKGAKKRDSDISTSSQHENAGTVPQTDDILEDEPTENAGEEDIPVIAHAPTTVQGKPDVGRETNASEQEAPAAVSEPEAMIIETALKTTGSVDVSASVVPSASHSFEPASFPMGPSESEISEQGTQPDIELQLKPTGSIDVSTGAPSSIPSFESATAPPVLPSPRGGSEAMTIEMQLKATGSVDVSADTPSSMIPVASLPSMGVSPLSPVSPTASELGAMTIEMELKTTGSVDVSTNDPSNPSLPVADLASTGPPIVPATIPESSEMPVPKSETESEPDPKSTDTVAKVNVANISNLSSSASTTSTSVVETNQSMSELISSGTEIGVEKQMGRVSSMGAIPESKEVAAPAVPPAPILAWTPETAHTASKLAVDTTINPPAGSVISPSGNRATSEGEDVTPSSSTGRNRRASLKTQKWKKRLASKKELKCADETAMDEVETSQVPSAPVTVATPPLGITTKVVQDDPTDVNLNSNSVVEAPAEPGATDKGLEPATDINLDTPSAPDCEVNESPDVGVMPSVLSSDKGLIQEEAGASVVSAMGKTEAAAASDIEELRSNTPKMETPKPVTTPNSFQQDLKNSFGAFDALLRQRQGVSESPDDDFTEYTIEELETNDLRKIHPASSDSNYESEYEEVTVAQSYMEYTVEETVRDMAKPPLPNERPPVHRNTASLLSSRMFASPQISNNDPTITVEHLSDDDMTQLTFDQSFAPVEKKPSLEILDATVCSSKSSKRESIKSGSAHGSLSGSRRSSKNDAGTMKSISAHGSTRRSSLGSRSTNKGDLVPISGGSRHSAFRRDSSGGGSRKSAGSKGALSIGSASSKQIADILKKDIWSREESVVKAALETLAFEARNGSKQRKKICQCGGVMGIIRAMESHSTSFGVQIAGCTALEKLAVDSETQIAIGEMGGIKTITEAMKSNPDKESVQQVGCAALANISCHRGESDAADGAVAVLCAAMKDHPTNMVVQAKAFGAIANLCMDNKDRLQELSDADGMLSMTMALQKPWPSKSEKHQAISNLSILLRCLAEHEEGQQESGEESDGYSVPQETVTRSDSSDLLSAMSGPDDDMDDEMEGDDVSTVVADAKTEDQQETGGDAEVARDLTTEKEVASKPEDNDVPAPGTSPEQPSTNTTTDKDSTSATDQQKTSEEETQATVDSSQPAVAEIKLTKSEEENAKKALKVLGFEAAPTPMKPNTPRSRDARHEEEENCIIS